MLQGVHIYGIEILYEHGVTMGSSILKRKEMEGY
jgi:hypothetical protein